MKGKTIAQHAHAVHSAQPAIESAWTSFAAVRLEKKRRASSSLRSPTVAEGEASGNGNDGSQKGRTCRTPKNLSTVTFGPLFTWQMKLLLGIAATTMWPSQLWNKSSHGMNDMGEQLKMRHRCSETTYAFSSLCVRSTTIVESKIPALHAHTVSRISTPAAIRAMLAALMQAQRTLPSI